jgi:hypothetical protein
MRRLLPLLALCATATAASAHGGHGAPDLHLHDAEMLGLWLLVGLSALAAAWIWFSGGRDQ